MYSICSKNELDMLQHVPDIAQNASSTQQQVPDYTQAKQVGFSLQSAESYYFIV